MPNVTFTPLDEESQEAAKAAMTSTEPEGTTREAQYQQVSTDPYHQKYAQGATTPIKKTRVAMVIGIIAAGLSMVFLICTLIYVLIGTVEDKFGDLVKDQLDSDSSSSLNLIAPTTADEKEASAAVTSKLADVENDQLARAMILATLDQDLDLWFGFTAKELGIDTTTYLNTVLKSIKTTDTQANVYSDGTGTVYVDVEMFDIYGFTDYIYDDLFAYLNQNMLYGSYTGEDDYEKPNAEQQSYINGKFAEWLAGYTDTTEETLYMDVKKKNNSWQVDEDSYYQELSYLLGYYGDIPENISSGTITTI